MSTMPSLFRCHSGISEGRCDQLKLPHCMGQNSTSLGNVSLGPQLYAQLFSITPARSGKPPVPFLEGRARNAMDHAWPTPPAVRCSSAEPSASAVAESTSPDWLLTNRTPPATSSIRQRCEGSPRYADSTIAAPVSIEPPAGSRHIPVARLRRRYVSVPTFSRTW